MTDRHGGGRIKRLVHSLETRAETDFYRTGSPSERLTLQAGRVGCFDTRADNTELFSTQSQRATDVNNKIILEPILALVTQSSISAQFVY